MPFSHGSTTVFLGNGYDLGPFFTDVGSSFMVDTVETTAFGAAGAPVVAKSYIPGLVDATLHGSGMFTFDATGLTLDGADDILRAAIRPVGAGVNRSQFCHLPYGDGFGNLVHGFDANETKYDITNTIADVVKTSMEAQSSVGREHGQVLHVLQPETASASGADLDAGVAYVPANYKGLFAYLHVTDIAGTAPSLTVKVQHSPDGITWTDLVTFAAVSVKHKAQRLSVSPGASNVYRHLRTIWTLTGTGGPTATFHVAAGRIPV